MALNGPGSGLALVTLGLENDLANPGTTAPTLAVVDDGDGSVTCTAANNAGQTSRLKYRYSGETEWTVGASVTGNGAVVGPTGLFKGAGALWYAFQLVPYESATGLEGAGGNFVFLHLEDSSVAAQVSDLETEQAANCDEILAENGVTVTYTPYGGAPAEVEAILGPVRTTTAERPEGMELTKARTVRLKKTNATSSDYRDTFTIDGVLWPVSAPPRPSGPWVVFDTERAADVTTAAGRIVKG